MEILGMHIEHVWMDCDGTLYVPPPQVLERQERVVSEALSKRTGAPSQDVRQKYRDGRKRYGTHVLSLQQFGLSREEARDLYSSVDITDLIEPDPLLSETLVSVRQMDIHVSIFTNSKRSKLLAILAKLQVNPDLFTFLGTAEEMPDKPSLAGYEEIITRSRCLPAEILYVGDSPMADIEPARRVGMHTLHVPNANPGVERDEIRGTYHFRRNRIYELADVVNKLSRL